MSRILLTAATAFLGGTLAVSGCQPQAAPCFNKPCIPSQCCPGQGPVPPAPAPTSA
jgi:hypothetical protein